MSESARTWDGKPIASEWPTGAAVIVYRRGRSGLEFLLLHRAHNGPEYDGDWAWTPPSGARFPGESIEACAERELLEEIGTSLELIRPEGGPEDWALFTAEAPQDMEVILHDPEHDRFEWLSLEVVLARCKPERVAKGMEWIAKHLGA